MIAERVFSCLFRSRFTALRIARSVYIPNAERYAYRSTSNARQQLRHCRGSPESQNSETSTRSPKKPVWSEAQVSLSVPRHLCDEGAANTAIYHSCHKQGQHLHVHCSRNKSPVGERLVNTNSEPKHVDCKCCFLRNLCHLGFDTGTNATSAFRTMHRSVLAHLKPSSFPLLP